jgi:sterol desaturase/sphingolipid hydroxylase (fatty acid hydroxylase superfamily)
MHAIRFLITYGLFPATFFAAMLYAYSAEKQGTNGAVIVVVAALSVIFIISVFERIHPKHRRWNKSHNDVKTDLLHLLVSQIMLPPLVDAGIKAVMLLVALKVSAYIGAEIWPVHWPVVMQLAMALLISQFGEYWVHRSMHEVPLLWRFHSVHHSPQRLYWLNAARFHPIDTAAANAVALAPLLLLGAPDNILILFSVWVAIHGVFQHCNIDIKLGPLNYLFSQAELHRWHHSLKLEEANSNYGNNIIFWDIVFGTMYYPKDKQASEKIGLDNLNNFPETYLQQLLVPFRWRAVNEATNNNRDPII